jgi:hypothetical protein
VLRVEDRLVPLQRIVDDDDVGGLVRSATPPAEVASRCPGRRASVRGRRSSPQRRRLQGRTHGAVLQLGPSLVQHRG